MSGTAAAALQLEHQQRVFDEFYQVARNHEHQGERQRGLGLGLATVRKLAEIVDCEVQLASWPQRGTRISVLLAPASAASASRIPEQADTPLDISGLRVLVVDDEPSILEGLRALLEQWGCDIRAAESEAQALEMLSGWDRAPDLAISDLRLREGRSGVDVLRAVARHYGQDPQSPGFARLLVTGETRSDRIGEIAASRIPVLFKPVSPQKLREAMLASVFAARANPELSRQTGDNSMNEAFAYDLLKYPAHIHQQMLPALLAPIARVHGVQAASPRKCHLLEVGCGDGLQLITLAMAYPDSRFVGVDMSTAAIARGEALRASLAWTTCAWSPPT